MRLGRAVLCCAVLCCAVLCCAGAVQVDPGATAAPPPSNQSMIAAVPCAPFMPPAQTWNVWVNSTFAAPGETGALAGLSADCSGPDQLPLEVSRGGCCWRRRLQRCHGAAACCTCCACLVHARQADGDTPPAGPPLAAGVPAGATQARSRARRAPPPAPPPHPTHTPTHPTPPHPHTHRPLAQLSQQQPAHDGCRLRHVLSSRPPPLQLFNQVGTLQGTASQLAGFTTLEGQNGTLINRRACSGRRAGV